METRVRETDWGAPLFRKRKPLLRMAAPLWGMMVAAMVPVMLMWTGCAATSGNASPQQRFSTADTAVNAMTDALKSGSTASLQAVFGPEGETLISSGDPVADQAERDRFLERYEERNRIEAESSEVKILYVGREDWPFPIPLVKEEDGWRFDTAAGAEELLARRIGRNELDTIQAALAYVDAQREYASRDRNGDGLLEYAQRFASEPGKKNGLYWEAGEEGDVSPLGPLFAEAQEEGYLLGKPEGQAQGAPTPYHGYYYRILKAQGNDAPGGAYDYRVRNKMIGGFALVAYPAQYGASGIMTFITSHDGFVFQKDLGEETETIARAMALFNPDDTWEPIHQHP